MRGTSYYKVKKLDNFYNLLLFFNLKYSNRIAIKYRKNNIIYETTYKDIITEVSSLYNYFRSNKIHNKNIGILSENRYEYVTIYLASVFDNVIAPIDKEFNELEISKIINKFDIKVLFYTNKTKSKLANIFKDKRLTCINIDTEYEKIITNKFDINTFFNKINNINNDKFSVLAFTSGTLGNIKGVKLIQFNIMSNLRAALQNNHLKSPTLQILPMNHTYGFNPGTLCPLYNGDTVFLNMNLKELTKDFKEYNPYFIAVVPMIANGIYNNIIREVKRQNKEKLFYRMIKISNILRKFGIDIRRLLFRNLINKRLHLIVSGGAYLDDELIDKYDEIGIKLLNGYGLTECSPLVAVNRVKKRIKNSVGTIIYGMDVKISETHEIMLKGNNVMLGYYKDEKETQNVMENDYFKTGDLGYIKAQNLFITGRKKNLIILENGKNFSPEIIEKQLLKLSYIKECVVLARKQKNTSIIVARLFIEDDIETIEDDIQNINKSLPSFMRIDKYEISNKEFKKTTTKKIIRSNIC